MTGEGFRAYNIQISKTRAERKRTARRGHKDPGEEEADRPVMAQNPGRTGTDHAEGGINPERSGDRRRAWKSMKLLHERISETAAAFPEKPAAEDINGTITYGELEARSAAFSAAMTASGFRAGDTAAVYVPYGRNVVMGMVSVFRTGGVCIPLDHKNPVKRLESILENCGVKAILTLRLLWEMHPLQAPGAKVFFLDEEPEVSGAFPAHAELTEDSPALLLYTSGTTGGPKGVPHDHHFLIHAADWMSSCEGAEMDTETRSGIMSSFAFVGAQIFMWGALSRGGTVCIAVEGVRQDPDSLYQFIRQARVTHMLVPVALAGILAEDYDIGDVRVFAAGERLRPFRGNFPGNSLINSYGSTELGGVTGGRVFGDVQTVTVGKPCAEIRIRIADEALRPVAEGETGELLISSGTMARQYFQNPELSAERWIQEEGTLWFRTGDRARRTENGEIEIIGRMDHLIKIRGYMIDPGEVEARIYEAIAQTGQSGIGSIKVVQKAVSGSEHLCCYYESKQEMDREAVRQEITRSLPDYMVPRFWVRMDALPRNANGKVLLDQLPQPAMERKALSTIDNEVVSVVTWAAAEVLETGEPVSPEDSFTALGGSSLTAVKLAEELRERGIRVSGAQILRLDNLRKISEAADVDWEKLWTPEEFERVRKDFARRGEKILKVLPLSPLQDEMLHDQMLHADLGNPLKGVLVQIDGIIPLERIREGLDFLAEEFEELRSSIVFHGVTSVQQVITDRKIPLEILRKGSLREGLLKRLDNLLYHQPMDLQYTPLMRVICAYVKNDTCLYFVSHRIAITKARRKIMMARLMRALETRYPDNESIREWRELMELKLSQSENSEEPRLVRVLKRNAPVRSRVEIPPEINVYSENEGPKLVFVHTGNTGSEAYYRLAERIRDRVSFAVIEPFNLYHPEEARRGIREIAAKYIEILKRHQPEGPYLLGGWCYGGVVAHEMACQLEQAGEQVKHLFLLDAHAVDNPELVTLTRSMSMEVNRSYFETSPLFAELREQGMLEAVVTNSAHVSEDLMNHRPSMFRGCTTYFKPGRIPENASEESRVYWETMMSFSAGNYENYTLKDHLHIVLTPGEHDLMMEKQALDVIVPELLRDLEIDAPKKQP